MGCNLFAGDCVLVAFAGIRLSVVDARTRQKPLVAPSVSVLKGTVLVEQALPSSEPTNSTWDLVIGRPGIYTVRVAAPGYLGWERNGVNVSTDRCGAVRTVSLRADLIPRP